MLYTCLMKLTVVRYEVGEDIGSQHVPSAEFRAFRTVNKQISHCAEFPWRGACGDSSNCGDIAAAVLVKRNSPCDVMGISVWWRSCGGVVEYCVLHFLQGARSVYLHCYPIFRILFERKPHEALIVIRPELTINGYHNGLPVRWVTLLRGVPATRVRASPTPALPITQLVYLSSESISGGSHQRATGASQGLNSGESPCPLRSDLANLMEA